MTGNAPRRLWRRLTSTIDGAPSRFRREVSTGAYRPEVDGLRFFAIAIVVIGHLFQRGDQFFPNFHAVADTEPGSAVLTVLPGLGVFLFFAVSGFIIATQARRSEKSPLSPSFLKAYFSRRVLRIEPPYLLVLLATWTLLVVTAYQPEGTRQFYTAPDSIHLSLLTSVVYLHDLIWGAFPRLFPPGWTLEVEVQFYVLAPLLFWLWRRLDGARFRAAFAICVWIAANVVATLMPTKIGPVFVGYSLLRYFGYFWLGVVLADSREAIDRLSARLRPSAVTAIGLIGLAMLVSLPEAPLSFLAGMAVRCAAGAAVGCMFFAALAPRSGFRRFCARPWIALVGGACYSIYLMHMQLIQATSVYVGKHAPGLSFGAVLAVMAMQAVLVVAVGLTFYVWVERPFMTPNWPALAAARLRELATRRPGDSGLRLARPGPPQASS